MRNDVVMKLVLTWNERVSLLIEDIYMAGNHRI